MKLIGDRVVMEVHTDNGLEWRTVDHVVLGGEFGSQAMPELADGEFIEQTLDGTVHVFKGRTW